MVPQPVLAVLLLFPITRASEQTKDDEVPPHSPPP